MIINHYIRDYLTHWAEAYSLPNQEAATVARMVFNECVCHFEAPGIIYSDQGKNFESNVLADLCQLLTVASEKGGGKGGECPLTFQNGGHCPPYLLRSMT